MQSSIPLPYDRPGGTREGRSLRLWVFCKLMYRTRLTSLDLRQDSADNLQVTAQRERLVGD